MKEQFGEKVHAGSFVGFMKDFAKYYAETEKTIAQRLLKSPCIHADETKMNIQGENWYVWIFTDGKHVVFKLTETRETAIVHEFLGNYDGILISDFYPGYDSINCIQQKCWVHLIRDLNDDLWTNPFNDEFETFIMEVRNLINTFAKNDLKKEVGLDVVKLCSRQTQLQQKGHSEHFSTFTKQTAKPHKNKCAAHERNHRSDVEHDRSSNNAGSFSLGRERWQLPDGTAFFQYCDSLVASLF
jgi:hypothetical protein